MYTDLLIINSHALVHVPMKHFQEIRLSPASPAAPASGQRRSREGIQSIGALAALAEPGDFMGGCRMNIVGISWMYVGDCCSSNSCDQKVIRFNFLTGLFLKEIVV